MSLQRTDRMHFRVIPKTVIKVIPSDSNRVALSAIIKLVDVHQISSESEIDMNYPIRCYQVHNFNRVKENSLLSVSEVVRFVGAFGALSKCGNCRSLGVIAFCSSECISRTSPSGVVALVEVLADLMPRCGG